MTDPSLTRRGRNQHSLTFQIPSAGKDVYKYMYSFFPQTIRDWNDLPESLSDDSVSKFTSLGEGLSIWRFTSKLFRFRLSCGTNLPGPVRYCHFGVSPVNYSDSEN